MFGNSSVNTMRVAALRRSSAPGAMLKRVIGLAEPSPVICAVGTVVETRTAGYRVGPWSCWAASHRTRRRCQAREKPAADDVQIGRQASVAGIHAASGNCGLGHADERARSDGDRARRYGSIDPATLARAQERFGEQDELGAVAGDFLLAQFLKHFTGHTSEKCPAGSGRETDRAPITRPAGRWTGARRRPPS